MQRVSTMPSSAASANKPIVMHASSSKCCLNSLASIAMSPLLVSAMASAVAIKASRYNVQRHNGRDQLSNRCFAAEKFRATVLMFESISLHFLTKMSEMTWLFSIRWTRECLSLM